MKNPIKDIHAGTYFGVPLYITSSFIWFFGGIIGIGLLEGIIRSFILWDIWPLLIAMQFMGIFSLKILTMYSFVILHEYGHIWAAVKYGVACSDVIIVPFSGVAGISNEWIREDYKKEFWITIAGPAVNLVLACLFLPLALMYQGYFAYCFEINVILMAFNLLMPVLPMDGGRIVRSLIFGNFGNWWWATVVTSVLGAIVALLTTYAIFESQITEYYIVAIILPIMLVMGLFDSFFTGDPREAARLQRKIAWYEHILKEVEQLPDHQRGRFVVYSKYAFEFFEDLRDEFRGDNEEQQKMLAYAKTWNDSFLSFVKYYTDQPANYKKYVIKTLIEQSKETDQQAVKKRLDLLLAEHFEGYRVFFKMSGIFASWSVSGFARLRGEFAKKCKLEKSSVNVIFDQRRGPADKWWVMKIPSQEAHDELKKLINSLPRDLLGCADAHMGMFLLTFVQEAIQNNKPIIVTVGKPTEGCKHSGIVQTDFLLEEEVDTDCDIGVEDKDLI